MNIFAFNLAIKFIEYKAKKAKLAADKAKRKRR